MTSRPWKKTGSAIRQNSSGSFSVSSSSSRDVSQAMSSSSQKEDIITPQPDINHYHDMIYSLATTPVLSSLLSRKIDPAEADRFAKALLEMTIATNCTMPLIHGLLEEEFISQAGNTTMRGNSLVTKLEGSYCRIIGRDYLKELFSQIILRIVTDTDLDLGTSIQRVQGPKASVLVEENRLRVMAVAQEFIDRFTSPEMVQKMPHEIKILASFISEFALKYDPTHRSQFLGGFVLLRFFNPAIITPETLDLLPDGIIPSKQDRTNLITITRLLQKIANQALSVDEEEQAWVNPFITNNHEKMDQYFRAICIETPKGFRYQDIFEKRQSFLAAAIEPKNLGLVHQLLYNHGYAVIKSLAEMGKKDTASDFLRMIILLGPPPRTKPLSGWAKEKSLHEIKVPLWLKPRIPTLKRVPLRPRYGQSACQMGSWCYIFGGQHADGSPPTQEECFLRLNLTTLEWQNIFTPAELIRNNHSSIAHNGVCYFFGGTYNKQAVNDLIVYDPVSERIYKIEPNKLDDPNHQPPSPRYGHTMGAHNNFLYVFGGYAMDGKKYEYTNSLYSFNLETKVWTKIELENPPKERVHHSSFMNGSDMWIFGGRTSDLEPLDDTYRLNLTRRVWEKIFTSDPSDSPPPRWGASLCAGTRKSMILFGGCDVSSILSDAWLFSFDTNSWSKIEYDVTVRVEPVSFHQSISHHGRMHVLFGGSFSTTGTLSGISQELGLEMHFKPQSTLASDILTLLHSQALSDATLTVKGTVFRVHKVILYARCRVLFEKVQESNNTVIEDLAPEVMYAILEYVYGEKVPVHLNTESTFSAIQMCIKLELYDLVRHLELSLESHLNENSLFYILETAEELNLRTIHLACLLLVKLHTKSVANSARLSHCPPDMIVEIAEQIFPSK